MSSPPVAPLRSFKTRQGRLGPGSVDALARLWPLLGCAVGDVPADPGLLFGRPVSRLALEIGSGMGETTAAMAAADPGTDVLAVEVHRPGLAALLRLVEGGGLANVRLVEGDAALLLARLGPGCLDEVRVFFPDPWPKARHHKRRLVRPAFAEAAARVLRPGGVVHVATDWRPYAEHALAVLRDHGGYDVGGGLVPRPPHRPVTRFEARGARAGRPSHDLLAVRRV